MARKKQADKEQAKRIIPLQYAEIYRDIKEVSEYIRETNEGAEEVCPVCMCVLDMLEHIEYGITTPAIRTGKGYSILNPEAEYLEDCIDYEEEPITLEEYFNSASEED